MTGADWGTLVLSRMPSYDDVRLQLLYSIPIRMYGGADDPSKLLRFKYVKQHVPT